jgi:hypothetical protein
VRQVQEAGAWPKEALELGLVGLEPVSPFVEAAGEFGAVKRLDL